MGERHHLVPAQVLPVLPHIAIPPLSTAVCCPAPVSFENGMYIPRLGSHPVGGNLSFECEDGFLLRGSPVRQCRPNGMWDGETAVCDNGGECLADGCMGARDSQGASVGQAWCSEGQSNILDFGQLRLAGPTSPAWREPGPRQLVPSFSSPYRLHTLSSFSRSLKAWLVFKPHGAEDR